MKNTIQLIAAICGSSRAGLGQKLNNDEAATKGKCIISDKIIKLVK